MARKKVYIAGPMTGIENYNKKNFDKAERLLEGLGYEAFNPAHTEVYERVQAENDPFEVQVKVGRECLAFDLEWICMNADIIYFLKGWERSKGSMAEFYTGLACGLEFMYE